MDFQVVGKVVSSWNLEKQMEKQGFLKFFSCRKEK
jgi:hypothetical protein